MIQANEIRIGNLFSHTNENGTFNIVVKEILESGINTYFNNGTWFIELDNIHPISLTEEILLKAGATKIGAKIYKFRHAFIVHETSSCFVIRLESEEGRFWNVMPFSYLHQLQNVYQLCMNQELKVEL